MTSFFLPTRNHFSSKKIPEKRRRTAGDRADFSIVIRSNLRVRCRDANRAIITTPFEGGFLNRCGIPLQHPTVARRLPVIAKGAGITKHITPHLFRHRRISHLIREGVPKSVITLMMRGNISTVMFKTSHYLDRLVREKGLAGKEGRCHRGVKVILSSFHSVHPQFCLLFLHF